MNQRSATPQPWLPLPAAPAGVDQWLAAGVAIVATVAVATAHRGNVLAAVALAAAVAIGGVLTLIDLQEHRLPNRIVGPLAAAVVVGLLVAGLVEGDLARTGRALGWGLAVGGVLLLGNLLGGLGMGDVKFGFPAAAVVGWFGWDAVVIFILATTVGGGVAGAGLLLAGKHRSHRLAYGPYLALGMAAGLIAAGSW